MAFCSGTRPDGSPCYRMVWADGMKCDDCWIVEQVMAITPESEAQAINETIERYRGVRTRVENIPFRFGQR